MIVELPKSDQLVFKEGIHRTRNRRVRHALEAINDVCCEDLTAFAAGETWIGLKVDALFEAKCPDLSPLRYLLAVLHHPGRCRMTSRHLGPKSEFQHKRLLLQVVILEIA